MWRRGNAFVLLVGMEIGVATVESSMAIPQKLKNGPAFLPSHAISGDISEGTQNTKLKEHGGGRGVQLGWGGGMGRKGTQL